MLARILYALLFCVALPLLFLAWTTYTHHLKLWPVPHQPLIAIVFLLLASHMILHSMWLLWNVGKGLPMNAYPPTTHVRNGWYRYMNHPIYVGAWFTYMGTALMLQNSSAFWLGSPTLALCCIALVYGYENRSVMKLFGLRDISNTWSLPTPDDAAPTIAQRVSVYFKLFLPWLALYELKVFPPISTDAINVRLSFESSIPVIEFTELFYLLVYPLVVSLPFLAKTRSQLRSFLIEGYGASAIGFFLLFLLPFVSPLTDFTPTSALGELLAFEQMQDSPATAFPSFHVLWALIACSAYINVYRSLKLLWLLLTGVIIVSCITTGMHSVVDLVAAAIIYAAIRNRHTLIELVRSLSQRMANSWRDWTFGGFRIINHSVWPGLACVTGILISNMFINDVRVPIVVTLFALVFGAMWGQVVEGSNRLLRPFGYYGSVLGGVTGIVCAFIAFDQPISNTLAAFAIATPWIQAIGRLRCWVQGCCHGAQTNSVFGIHYYHPKSRVLKISELHGVPLHNTQLFSIITNVVCGLILIRLVWSQQSPSLICGLYFILSSAARFVEESLRGEAQTKIVLGLRLYQWLAIVGVVVGIALTCIPTTTVLSPHLLFSVSDIVAALACGFLAAFAMGMDFPRSNVRFSRLAD